MSRSRGICGSSHVTFGPSSRPRPGTKIGWVGVRREDHISCAGPRRRARALGRIRMQVGSRGRRRIRRTLLSVLALLAAVFTIAAPSAQATAAVTITTADDGGVVVHVVT